MRRWVLLGAPVLMAGSAAWGWHAGGAAAGMLGLMLMSLTQRPVVYPYPRRRGVAPARLFFSCGAAAFLLILWQAGMAALPGETAGTYAVWLNVLGILPACALCGRLVTLPLHAKAAWGFGGVFWLAAGMAALVFGA